MEKNVEKLRDSVLSKAKYRHVDPDLIASLVRTELLKRQSDKSTLKAVTGKLHQIGAAYFQRKPDYPGWQARLADYPQDVHSDKLKEFCLQVMECHSSTNERLPILKDFFKQTLKSIGPIDSVIDLACGLNPLAIAWMPVTQDVSYFGCDIFSDMTEFLNAFYDHIHQIGHFSTVDLTEMRVPYKAKVAFLLKALPCLEQLEKGINAELLEAVPADYILISYPVRSLSGRAKGMGKTYEEQFNQLIGEKGWDFERFEFPTELAFLVRKA